MNGTFDNVLMAVFKNQEQAYALMDKLLNVAKSVYGEPVVSGDYTVITAAEVGVGMGFGTGFGGGQGPTEEMEPTRAASENAGGGGGTGGGGGAGARPIAAIIIGPNGVRVEPIVDPTKMALAFFTMLGAMGMTFARMRRAARK